MRPWKKFGAFVAALLMAATLVVGISSIDPEPAAAHTIRSCALRSLYGSPTRTIASDTYSGHSSPTNCEVQARLSRTRAGTSAVRANYYSGWKIIEARVSSWSGTSWNLGARNCGRIKVPSTGYKSNWACAY